MTVRPVGADATVIWYCVRNEQVYVASAATVMVRGFAVEPSFHCVKTYCTPAAPGWGLWHSIVCIVLATNDLATGAGAYASASKCTRRFVDGAVWSVIVNRWNPVV